MKYFFIPVVFALAATLSCSYAATEPEKGTCILPSSPNYGQYKVNGPTNPDPAKAYDTISITYSCNRGYIVLGNSERICKQGVWSDEPICVQCGTISPASELRLPWHAAVYTKKYTPYRQQCGATLVSSKAVLSVAHWFWDSTNNKPLPAQDFAVAVGKLYRPWGVAEDQFAQKSDVSDIKIPPRFLGEATNLQDDISVVILATEVTFNPNVRPVCLDFSVDIETRQLQANNLGKIASWVSSGIEPNKEPPKVLKVLEIPYISIEECLSSVPSEFQAFFTSDKFCAGSNDTDLCRGNGGSGISFSDQDEDVSRYYLRGMASSSPASSYQCSSSLTLLTQVSKHEAFIKQFI